MTTAVRRRRPYTPRRPASARREQVLDAALTIIGRDGYGAVSIEAIARELEVTRPVVYHVYDGLDELLNALLDRQEQRALDQLLATISVDVDLRDFAGFLDRTIRALVAMVAEDPLTWGPIFRANDGTPPAVRARIDRDREVVRRRMQAIADLALGAGAAKGIDTAVVSHALVAMGEYFGRMILDAPDSIEPERLASTITALLASFASPS